MPHVTGNTQLLVSTHKEGANTTPLPAAGEHDVLPPDETLLSAGHGVLEQGAASLTTVHGVPA